MFYSSFGLLALVLHLIVNYDVLITNRYKEYFPANRPYRAYLFCVLVYYITDILWGILYDLKIIPIVYIDTMIYYASMALTIFLWTRYVVAYLNTNGFFAKLLKYAGYLSVAYGGVTLIINLFVPIAFEFAPDGTYVPHSSRYLNFYSQLGLFVLASLYSLYKAIGKDVKHRKHHRTIGISGITMSCFTVLQIIDPFLPFYAIGCMLGTCLLHIFVLEDEKEERKNQLEELLKREKKQRQELENAKRMAYTDSLTGVKSKAAYFEAEGKIDNRIRNDELKDFAVGVFDLNNLKYINDTKGHEEGDKMICEACRMICRRFKHSPVFRIGGDEFAVFFEGEDFKARNELFAEFDQVAEENNKTAGVVIAGGLEDYIPGTDMECQSIFDRADKKMYERKAALKAAAKKPD